jgi:hypothetical protein
MNVYTQIMFISTQIIGIFLILNNLLRAQEVKELSGTYWDSNPNMTRYLLKDNYQKSVGILVMIVPNILYSVTFITDAAKTLIFMALLAISILVGFCINNWIIEKLSR